MIVNLPITPEKRRRTILRIVELVRLMDGYIVSSKSCGSEKASCVVWQLECQTSNATARVQK